MSTVSLSSMLLLLALSAIIPSACSHRTQPNFSRAEFYWGQAQSAGAGRYAPDRMLEAERLVASARDLNSRAKEVEASKALLLAESVLIEAERVSRQIGGREEAFAPRPKRAPVAAPPPPMKLEADRSLELYRVKRGDTLWEISARQNIYGNPWRWGRLFEANRHALRNPHRLKPGQKLVVPRVAVKVPPKRAKTPKPKPAPRPLASPAAEKREALPEMPPPTQDESKK